MKEKAKWEVQESRWEKEEGKEEQQRWWWWWWTSELSYEEDQD